MASAPEQGGRAIADRWTSISGDPNSVEAVRLRAQQLGAVRTLERVGTRERFLMEVVRGRRVLDIGCVDHFADAVRRPGFLHSKIAAAAGTCLGVDIDADGVRELARHGYDALHADVTVEHEREVIARRGPFDVIVAGEVIEHLETPGSLFALAAECLDGDGCLVLTTPNPYAAHRVAAGRRLLSWENADHVTYLFPSGIVELASRHGLILDAAGTTGPRAWSSPAYLAARWLGVRLLGAKRVARLERRRQAPDEPEYGPDLLARADGSRSFRDVPILAAIQLAFARGVERAWLGETALYVLRRS